MAVEKKNIFYQILLNLYPTRQFLREEKKQDFRKGMSDIMQVAFTQNYRNVITRTFQINKLQLLNIKMEPI